MTPSYQLSNCFPHCLKEYCLGFFFTQKKNYSFRLSTLIMKMFGSLGMQANTLVRIWRFSTSKYLPEGKSMFFAKRFILLKHQKLGGPGSKGVKNQNTPQGLPQPQSQVPKPSHQMMTDSYLKPPRFLPGQSQSAVFTKCPLQCLRRGVFPWSSATWSICSAATAKTSVLGLLMPGYQGATFQKCVSLLGTYLPCFTHSKAWVHMREERFLQWTFQFCE